MKHMSSQYHIPMIIQGVYSCFEQQERRDIGGGRGVTGVVPVKECGAKEKPVAGWKTFGPRV